MNECDIPRRECPWDESRGDARIAVLEIELRHVRERLDYTAGLLSTSSKDINAIQAKLDRLSTGMTVGKAFIITGISIISGVSAVLGYFGLRFTLGH